MSKKRRRRKKTRTPVRTATVALIVVAAFLVLFTAAQKSRTARSNGRKNVSVFFFSKATL